jgi:predicted TPR repeat methyltransferase
MSADTATALGRAIAAHKAGRYEEAEAGYQSVLQGRPADADALNFLGMLRFHRGEPAAAAELLRRSVEADPDNPHARINLGNVLMAGNELAGAHEAFEKATGLAPHLAIGWYNLGVCLRRLHRPQDAATCLHKAVTLDPHHAPAHDTLARLLYGLGRRSEAVDVYRAWLAVEPDNPIARHMLAAVSGEGTPVRADDQYVQAVFDHFAESFDQNLSELGYRAPQLLAEALAERLPPQAKVDILDAGCGTGLCGPLMRPSARRLVGVDLSPGMVGKARPRGAYDELCVQELCEFMRSRPAAFDVVLSADTLVYFGALGEAMGAARRCLREGGTLAFTLERLDAGSATQSFRLEGHGRYSHAEWYVRDVLMAAGFHDVALRTDTLRSEAGEQVTGHIVTAVA